MLQMTEAISFEVMLNFAGVQCPPHSGVPSTSPTGWLKTLGLPIGPSRILTGMSGSWLMGYPTGNSLFCASRLPLRLIWETSLITLSNHYIQIDKHYSKNAFWMNCLCIQMGTYFIVLQLLLCYAEILLERYPVWQLTVPSSLVVKQNFLNTNVIVNYHILIRI